MAEKLSELVRAVERILPERRRLAQAERKVVNALNRALGRIGYKVVAKTEPERQRMRQARKKVAARKRRRRRAKGK